ncbi:hypothetical protein FE257_009150 [Aspergillus nanangensis]|uniref:Alpha/beta hydrolase fold-3 domain-containing protein n=1 Tax=Aspergillus nanangensis TaxID=2582783 RepID=A0AAD4GYN3_ASPNN|nr:hypothetical protein FE257_009150 [Aspergillus nanangensis]
MKSDLILDASKLWASAISPSRQNYLNQLQATSEGKPSLATDTIAVFRQVSENAAVVLPDGVDLFIPSHEPGRSIPCRMFRPKNGIPIKGVLMHIHGGGYVLNTEKTSDATLRRYVDITEHAVISVGYRRAPEHVFPAALRDCCDVADYLVTDGEAQLGAQLSIIAGDGLPSVHHVKNTHIVDGETRERYISWYLPGYDTKDLQRSDVAPLYTNLEEFRGRLPPALFLCGTVEALLDDSMMMCIKWIQGGEGILKLVPGGFHRFMAMPEEEVEAAKEGWSHVAEFLNEIMFA